MSYRIPSFISGLPTWHWFETNVEKINPEHLDTIEPGTRLVYLRGLGKPPAYIISERFSPAEGLKVVGVDSFGQAVDTTIKPDDLRRSRDIGLYRFPAELPEDIVYYEHISWPEGDPPPGNELVHNYPRKESLINEPNIAGGKRSRRRRRRRSRYTRRRRY